MDEDTLSQLNQIIRELRKVIYSIKKPEFILFDIDSTLLDTYGNQEGEGFNYHYQAGSWSHPRRVVFKIEKPYGQMVRLYTFIVTTMEMEPYQVIQFYCGRGRMENFIKEGKSGFDFASVSSSCKLVNANRLQVHALAYNFFNWFRRLARLLLSA